MNAHQIVEAVLFASDAPLTADEIARADEMLDEDEVEASLQHLRAEYDDAGRSFEIVEVAEGFQILTRPEFAPYLERFDNVPRATRLSGPSLETLAIIAYRQPLARLEVEYIRGVGASGVIRTLQDRRLIDVVGRGEGLGRPLLYGTTSYFLEHFGFKSLEDLPRPDELPIVLRERIPLGIDDAADEPGPEDDAQVEMEGVLGEGEAQEQEAATREETEEHDVDDAPDVDGAGDDVAADAPSGEHGKGEFEEGEVEASDDAEPTESLTRPETV